MYEKLYELAGDLYYKIHTNSLSLDQVFPLLRTYFMDNSQEADAATTLLHPHLNIALSAMCLLPARLPAPLRTKEETETEWLTDWEGREEEEEALSPSLYPHLFNYTTSMLRSKILKRC